MRLICPNCGAQYEVDGSLIPETGRDVQCSNCSHSWFQHPEDKAGAEVESGTAGAAAETPRRKRELDPSVTGVLREEAEREAAARRAESGDGLQSQPELGLEDEDAAPPRSGAAERTRMERLRKFDEEAPPPEDQTSRRELLPDVDEINSTLRSDEARRVTPTLDDTDEEPQRRRGFRTGFLLVLLLCLIAVIVYAIAPMLANRVPQAEPFLTAYVEQVNAVRTQVNAWVAAGIGKIRELTGGA